jgi:hypothetical protein
MPTLDHICLQALLLVKAMAATQGGTMNLTTAPAAKPGRGIARALRSLHPAAASALTLALVIGGAGIADAATGGNFILGKTNKETSTASLSSSRGTPLSLAAPKGRPPLAVNRKVMVKNLNANYVSGLSATQLAAAGGDGIRTTSITLGGPQKEVAGTGALPAGTYYVTATAWLDVMAGDSYGLCYIAKGSAPFTQLTTGGGNTSGGHLQAAETIAVTVHAGDRLQEWCYAGGSNGTTAINAAITAIRILSSKGTPPA